MKLTLKRTNKTGISITGELLIDNFPFCLTLERKGVEIPVGRYTVEATYSPKFKETRPLVNVPGREGIRFHSGSVATDSDGCILLGDKLLDAETLTGGLSRGIVKRFNTVVLSQLPGILEVTNDY